MSELIPRKEPRILIVDDSLSDILVMQKALAGLGQIYTAGSGRQGMDQIALLKPEIVVLDVEMPDVSGIEICQSIRDNPSLSHTRVIFVTVHEDSHTEYLSFKSGADDYLIKPYNLNICRFRISNQINMLGLYRENALLMEMLELAPSAISAWSEAGDCLYANDRFLDVFAVRESTLIGHHLSELVGEQLAEKCWQQSRDGISQIHHQGEADEPVRFLKGTLHHNNPVDSNAIVVFTVENLELNE